MTRDRSLDEFVGGDGSDDESDDADEDGVEGQDSSNSAPSDHWSDDSTVDSTADDTAENDTTDTADDTATADPESVEPVAPTFTAAPEDEPCARCGATVGVRWRAEDGESYVCADCKEW